MTEKNEFISCIYCNSTNIYECDGLWYCNVCGQVWDNNTIFEGRKN